MYHQFRSDYIELADSRILEALAKYASEQNIPYGFDYHSENASKYILKKFSSHGKVYFLEGGTQTNMVFISYCLKPYEGVIAVDTGHINVHESASVEGSGHKIIPVKNVNGKIYPSDILKVLELNNDVHTVVPRMIYISNSTEIGTIYTKKELEDLYAFSKEHNLYFFIDGARLGSALTSKENDVKAEDYGRLCDAFYIGGTKCGALFGEAVVVPQRNFIPHFFTIIKQHGALLAKGRIAGIQFETLFTENLYDKIGQTAIEAADRIRKALSDKGYKLAIPSPTNQIFIELDKAQLAALSEKVELGFWENLDENHIIMRIATSWATRQEDVDRLIASL